jgi:muramidase (phage lysozyme)
MTNYEKAFLDLLSYCEGTYGKSKNGYDVLYSQKPSELRVINNWTENTTIIHGKEKWKVALNNDNTLFTTAAGRYQFIGSTWEEMNNKINAPMTKVNQDNAALKLVKRILGQNFNFNITNESEMTEITNKLKNTWTSLNKFKPDNTLLLYKQAYYKYN